MDIESKDKNLMNLMAYIVQLDGKVSNEEIELFNTFIRDRYPKDESKTLFNGFLSALKQRPLLESVLEDVRSTHGDDYRANLEFVIRLYELIAADEIEEHELVTFKTICGFLEIRDEDTDLIISLLIDGYEYEFIENVRRKITVGENQQQFNVVYPGVNLELIKLHEMVFLLNKDSKTPVFVNEEQLYTKRIQKVGEGEVIDFEGGEIRGGDLPLLFQFKEKEEKKRILYAFTGGRLVRKLKETEADFRIETDGPLIRLYRNTAKECEIRINDEPVEEFSFVNLSDTIVINKAYTVEPKDLLFIGGNRELSLEERRAEKVNLVISDASQDADIFVDDETDLELRISVERIREAKRFVFFLRFEKLPYPVYVAGEERRESDTANLRENATLVIGRNQVFFDCGSGEIESSKIHFHEFRANDLTYKFDNGKIGIDAVNFTVHKGELVSIMGASGSGKSTLMQLLLGYLTPFSGSVTINGNDFHENFNAIRHYIGYVPQDDLLMENLTVYENMLYTAKIRMPSKSKGEIDYLIDSVLKDIGLQDKKHLKAGSPVEKVLSGGQRKRLNIGLELLEDPDLFFLDEPTSGLSSRDSESIVDLLTEYARKGKIIFVIIHQPSSDIFKKFDKLLLLDVGGKLAYFGDAMEGIRYFKQFLPVKDTFIECPACGNANPEVIFNVLETKELGKDGLPVFTERKEYGKGLAGLFRRIFNKPRIVSEPKRRYDADYWNRLFISKKAAAEEAEDPAGADSGRGAAGPAAAGKPAGKEAGESAIDALLSTLPPKPKRSPFAGVKIMFTLFMRNLADKFKDRTNLIMTIGVPIILGVLMSMLLRGENEPYLFSFNAEFSKYLFLSVVVFVFFGLMASVNEVIKDRPILNRERIIGIRPYQYLFSKAGVYIIFALMQVVLYVVIGFWVLQVPWRVPEQFQHIGGSNFLLYFILIGFITVYVSFSLGLFLSSVLKSQLAAFNVIPLVIIPQIIFGGLFVGFGSMGKIINDEVPIYANLTFARWSYEALLSGSEVFNPTYTVTNTDEVKKLRAEYEASGLTWDYGEVVGEPLREMKKTLAGPLPEKISYSLYETYFKEPLSERAPEFWEDAKELFVLGDEEEYVLLPENIREEEEERLREVFFRANPDGFYTLFQLYEANRVVHVLFFDVRTLQWLDKLRSTASYRFSDWFVGRNIFPAHDKIWGLYRFRTVWFNFVILLCMIVILHGLTMRRLKKI